MLKNRWALAAACAWLFAGEVLLSAASAPHYTIDGWDTEKGLPQMSVIALTQTRDGYLWLGTGDGLARFDGLHFKRYDENDALQLSGSKIVRLYEDRRGNLWIGTDTAGVLRVAPDGKLTTQAVGQPSADGPLVGICEDRVGGTWLRMANGRLYWYVQDTAHLVANNCSGLLAEDSGIVWVGSSDERLIGLGPVSNAVPPAVFPVSYEIQVGKLDYLLASKQGGYWRLADGRIQKVEGGRAPARLRSVSLGPGCAGSVGLRGSGGQSGRRHLRRRRLVAGRRGQIHTGGRPAESFHFFIAGRS